MKRVLLLLLFIGVLATACDPEWALNPQNEGSAYIVNKTDADIIFRGYTSFSGLLYTEVIISPGDTVCVSKASWDERSNNWNKMIQAGWDPFLATVAKRWYSGITGDFDVYHHTITIVTSPTDSISWTLDVDNIKDDSIFNEANWVKEVSNEGYPTYHSWYYTIE